MASLLVGKPCEIWSELYTNIGFGYKDNVQVEITIKILSFSYYDLPSHLRGCLLYLSAFPEDYFIDKEALIWMWIAEGLVHKEDGKCLFEVGEGYFNDLINRSMIQAVESESERGIVRGCRVHDMVLDLICSLSWQENFITILDDVGGTSSSQNKVHRLAFQKSTAEDITEQYDHMNMRHVRSYIACICSINQQVHLLGFKLLRVLAIENCQFTEHCNLDHLGNLIHLRYLSLRLTKMHKLPDQIGDLRFLQTLHLVGNGITQLPESIVRLRQLLCLSCGRAIMDVPGGIGKLTSLEQLTIKYSLLEDDNEDSIGRFVKDLGNLRELRSLKITDWSAKAMDENVQRYFVESLRKLHKIQHLDLSFFVQQQMYDLGEEEDGIGNVCIVHDTADGDTWE
ncbi:unnamed protein product [Urochloa humidicola]